MAAVRKRILYKGNVQGVGFRYTTVRVAAGYAVSGYVRNLPDGGVEVMVEGQGKEIVEFMNDLASRMIGYIRDTQVNDGSATGEFTGFDVRF